MSILEEICVVRTLVGKEPIGKKILLRKKSTLFHVKNNMNRKLHHENPAKKPNWITWIEGKRVQHVLTPPVGSVT